jgi:hypothetical protein
MIGRLRRTEAEPSRLGVLLALALGACAIAEDTSEEVATDAASASGAVTGGPPAGVAPPLFEGPHGTFAKPTGTAESRARSGSCGPSLSHRRRIDARTSDALERCEDLKTGLAKLSKSCGVGERRAKDVARFAASVPPLDDATVERVRAIFAQGKKLGRDPRVFGLVGDSITVSSDFLGAFASKSERRVVTTPWVDEQLRTKSGGSVIEYFRSGVAEKESGVTRDPFDCYRAAKVGARASWACEMEETGASPIEQLVTRVNPAYAIVTFGANDAAFRLSSPERVAEEFEKNLLAAVTSLEARGVVVIVSNEMRHGDQPGVKACPKDAPNNDWSTAVATNATSARAAEVACREHLPFIDLRHALDAATNYGLGPDGVHLTTFQRGAGVLDEEGLDCGNNIRNLVTLVALRRVVDATATAE